MISDLPSLLSRVKAASGADRELDIAIVQYCFPNIGPYRPMCTGDEPIFWNEPFRKEYCPKLTADTHAALDLVERMLPGLDMHLGRVNRVWICELETSSGWVAALHKDRQLAIILALLRALERKNDAEQAR